MCGLILSAILHSSLVFAEWNGYVNSKTLEDRAYGFMGSVSISDKTSKLKLVCFQPDNYEIYLDEEITNSLKSGLVKISVDNLPELEFPTEQNGEVIKFSNQAAGFWNLVAQMAAGAVINLDTGTGVQHRYSLSGFTLAYQMYCGWIKSAGKYREYLDQYR